MQTSEFGHIHQPASDFRAFQLTFNLVWGFHDDRLNLIQTFGCRNKGTPPDSQVHREQTQQITDPTCQLSYPKQQPWSL
jgi:hypothetical protein